MCRFLIVRAAAPFDPRELLTEFAEMARLSRAPDGDRQADGWGVASGLLNAHGTSWVPPETGPPSKCSLMSNPSARFAFRDACPKAVPHPPHHAEIPNSGWKVLKSLRPIWEDGNAWADVPSCRILLVHARSASFPSQKRDLEYNQPFFDGDRAFVFNGLIRGVAFPRPLEGRIGAQKIWSLLKPAPVAGSVEEDLRAAVELIAAHAREVSALNVGLVEGERIAVYAHPAASDYYRLWLAADAGVSAVSSEPLPALPFRPLPSGIVHTI
jgi:predicted glutamine amidotransferase